MSLAHTASPFLTFLYIRYGSDNVIEAVLVKMTSGKVSAWGETCPLAAPTYSNEHAGGVFCVMKEHFLKQVVGKSFSSSEDLAAALSFFKGNAFAKGGLDTAWWALQSALTGKPLHALVSESSGLQVKDATATGCL